MSKTRMIIPARWCLADCGNNFVRFPGIAAPDLHDFSVWIDQRRGESVRQNSPFGLAINRESRRQLVDLFRVPGSETPHLRVFVRMRAVLFQNFGCVECRIESDAQQTGVRRRAGFVLNQILQLREIARHPWTKIRDCATGENKVEHERMAVKCVRADLLSILVGQQKRRHRVALFEAR